MAEKERVLITIKTYPTLSSKYLELSCTAGLRGNGTWVRLHPIPFRLLKEDTRYAKYQWIEAELAKNEADERPESYRILNVHGISPLKKVGTAHGWSERRKIVLEKAGIYTSLEDLIVLAHSNKVSLAVFKPSKIIDFVVEAAEPQWATDKLDRVLKSLKQQDLFAGHSLEDFKIMPKLPKKFSYKFEDDSGRDSTLMITDWETGQLYWNCLKKTSEAKAVRMVREKYLDDFALKKDLHFFLGTTMEWHRRKATNPYLIVGTFHPPLSHQPSLLDL